ncbi:MAG TPA: hypothetical protein VG317_17605 [Pseudonocardiaceae bacterium]|nr:hypothetical protein [Pseudonocardiaceae bacterium]
MNVYQLGIEQDREDVRRMTSDTWREPAAVLQINGFHPRYKVAGRRADGASDNEISVQQQDTGNISKQNLRTATGMSENKNSVPILGTIGAILVFIAAVVIRVFSPHSGLWGAGPSDRSSSNQQPLRGTVEGAAECLALSFADTATAHPGKLWLAWSPSWLALVHAGGQPHILWQSRGGDRPTFDRQKLRLVWRDQSVAQLPVSRSEWKRFEQRQGG